MKTIKKIISVVLVIVLMLTANFVTGITASAASTYTSSISVNTTYSGNITNGYDYQKYYYQFNIYQNGYATVSFTNTKQQLTDTTEAWDFRLLEGDQSTVIMEETICLNDGKFSFTTLGLAPGTYYILVQSDSWYQAVSTAKYNVRVDFTQADNWEKEVSKTPETATVIAVNKDYYGTIHNGHDYDKDYYVFTTPSDGYVTVDFTNTNPLLTSNTDAWQIVFYSLTSDGLKEITSETISEKDKKVSMITIGLPKGTYYIEVQSDSWYQAVTDCKYIVRAKFSSSKYWEKEFNDDTASATPIKVNTSYNGTTRNGYDYEKDYYVFNTTKAGYVTVDFTNTKPLLSSSAEIWNVTLYGVFEDELTEINTMTVSAKDKKASMITFGLPKGTYYIKVQSNSWYQAVETYKYTICATFTASNNWEKEFNNNSTSATSIKLNEKYSGTIYNGYDYENDYYKVKTTKKSTIDVAFYNTKPTSSEDEAFEVTVYDSRLNSLATQTVNANSKSVAIKLKNKPAGTYYIKVQSDSWYQAVLTTPYQIKVTSHKNGKHSYTNACDANCNECNAKRTIPHSYKSSVKKATLSKNGQLTKTCKICKQKVTSVIRYPKTFKLSGYAYLYNGKVKKPTVTVKDSAGKTISSKYYTVSYQAGRKNVGKYKVTVKFKGNYSGTKYLYFTIVPPKSAVSKLTAGKKSLTVNLTQKSTQVTGYQIQYATNKSFKSAKTKTISSYKTTKTTLKGLSAKKTYYVRVRTYKKVGKTTYYSSWSAGKYKKTK